MQVEDCIDWSLALCSTNSTALERHNLENSKQIFPEKELLSLSPNFHSHVFVSDLNFRYCVFAVCRSAAHGLRKPMRALAWFHRMHLKFSLQILSQTIIYSFSPSLGMKHGSVRKGGRGVLSPIDFLLFSFVTLTARLRHKNQPWLMAKIHHKGALGFLHELAHPRPLTTNSIGAILIIY